MRVAVTGGAGFIGSHVVDKLLDAGHDVVSVDRVPSHRPDVELRRADITDLASVERALRHCDVVYHLAAVADVNVAFRHPSETVKINVGGTANVWEAATRVGATRVVLASTVWVYGAAAGIEPLDEEVPFAPERAGHLYTSTKLSAELIAHSYSELYELPFTILRYGIPYGPRMREELVLARFVAKALAGEPITIQGDGSQCRNYLYVEDLADAHVEALSTAAVNETFNLEGPEPISVRRVAEAVQAALGDVEIHSVPARAGDFRGRVISAAKARRVLGWSASTPFEEGVQRYVDWFLNRNEVVRVPS